MGRTLASIASLLALPALALADKPADSDGTRLGAVEIRANEPVNDSVAAGGDAIDWKRLQLAGAPGEATFQVNWDEAGADVGIDVYNEDGVNVAASPKRVEQQTGKKLTVKIDPVGLYYVKVTALAGSTVYTLRCKWSVAGATPPPPPPANPNNVRCKVVQSFRADDGALALYLDVGFAANIQPGMAGELLVGPDGDNLLDGSLFTITKVIDAARSVAKSQTLPKVGKNNRCVVHLVP